MKTRFPFKGQIRLADVLQSINRTGLLLKDQRRPADSLPLEVDRHLDTVGDLDEGNAFIHPVILTIETHCPLDLT